MFSCQKKNIINEDAQLLNLRQASCSHMASYGVWQIYSTTKKLVLIFVAFETYLSK